jgi:hypothetical protein
VTILLPNINFTRANDDACLYIIYNHQGEFDSLLNVI